MDDGGYGCHVRHILVVEYEIPMSLWAFCYPYHTNVVHYVDLGALRLQGIIRLRAHMVETLSWAAVEGLRPLWYDRGTYSIVMPFDAGKTIVRLSS